MPETNKHILKKIFYKPSFTRILFDIIAWFFTIGIMLFWRYSSHKFVVFEYFILFMYIFIFWFVVSYIFGKYRQLRKYDFFKEFFKITMISAIVFGSIYYGIVLDFINFKIYSEYIAVTISLTIIALNYMFLFLHYGYRYAANMDVELPQFESRQASQVLSEPHKIDKNCIDEIKAAISGVACPKAMEFIAKNINIESSNTKLLHTTVLTNFYTLKQFRYDAIINIAKLNSIRGINEVLNKVNEKLPDDGLFCCCYQSINQFNKKIRKRFPFVIRDIVQTYYFITKRLLPKIFITNRLYFDITRGKSRIFSDVEVIGRLYYCGFEIVGQYEDESLNWLIARRTANPQMLVNKHYGVIIKLERVCKDKKLVPIYKMRTMYPYSEYIQKYLYEQHGIDDIGKIKDDIRITKWGKFFRKFWLDELPMFWNLLKGDLKIVGVRPISLANFRTYPQYLQDKRAKVKPGLIPPMYADLPKTEQEFYDSEERYVDSYLNYPLKTDIKYFFKAIYNIVFKKARSH
jgi:lipopolysaccharide/colanic/teichoic acid biosynthesis glycosyltransferase